MPKPRPKSKIITKSKKNLSSKTPGKAVQKGVPNAYIIFRNSIQILINEWKTVSLILLAYILATLFFSSGSITLSAVSQVKSTNSGVHGFHGSLSILNSLFSSSFTSSSTNSGAQTVLFVIFSLVSIWYVKQLYQKKHPKARDALYKSQAPLIPFFIAFIIIFIELLPSLVAIYLYDTIVNSGIAVNVGEKIIWTIVCLALALISLFLVESSIFSLYLVTEPEARPVSTLRASWRMVKGRRAMIFRKVYFLPVALGVLISLISILFIVVIPGLAGWVFLILSLSAVVVAHSYMYALYKELA